MSQPRSKYQVGPRTKWSHKHNVRFSDHALDRWDERTPTDSVSPEAAWEHGEDLPHPSLVAGPDGIDRARVYRTRQYCVVFRVQDGVIITVIDAAKIEHGPTRSYVFSYGPHGEADE